MNMQHRQRGATALEFAIVFPLLILILVGTLAIAMAVTQSLALSTVASATARCLSISGPPCTRTPPADCAAADAGICYAIAASRVQAFKPLSADAVTISQTADATGAKVVHVSIQQPLSLFGLIAPSIRAQAEVPVAE